MIKTPVTRHDVFTSSFVDKFGSFLDDKSLEEAAKRINMHNKLMRALCEIQQMCIGDIAMGYKLEAETIGQLISAATGLTAPELMEKCK